MSYRLSFPSQSKLRLTVPRKNKRNISSPLILCCSEPTTTTSTTNSTAVISTSTSTNTAPPVIKKRVRYRKQYPGESIGITEEMRFVAMKLRNLNGKKYPSSSVNSGSDREDSQDSSNDDLKQEKSKESLDDGEIWKPSMEGFVKFLVDSQLVFNTVERIVDESNDVAYAYFRNTGLERSEGLAKDLEWFREQDIVIPDASTSGVSYAKYLEELAERSAPLFLSHFYNIYFSHIAGGEVIARQVSEKILEGREMEFYRWEGDPQEILKGVRKNLNMLGEHWPRDEKHKCLKEAAKSFKFLGQIVRLIIL
ncbi:probable inactive heme oxygenase 2, chloroplastic [Pistacia vera]|uniref:probable inactive heme oxygenase 2, chloroplastic n=1 Tax=Pistacia vera TaxID=55513 RepID=UPI0012634711|nr:probable inactive heme oxygenase 2, chloroplastic [Pistacia vera]XP_031273532.1 probable inactive heme oxygenase 2, chloroplastic [Pistacia vera]XP_031273533.1 probable inactive heme oxygenase 2, chloroplastic [Pistacia vera]